MQVEHLHPPEYRAFVEAVGYPVVGFRYYCRKAFSFLPVEHQETHSQSIFIDGDPLLEPSDARVRSPAAFFAGNDLSDLGGFAFIDTSDRGLVVASVEYCGLDEIVGTFSDWLCACTGWRIRATLRIDTG